MKIASLVNYDSPSEIKKRKKVVCVAQMPILAGFLTVYEGKCVYWECKNKLSGSEDEDEEVSDGEMGFPERCLLAVLELFGKSSLVSIYMNRSVLINTN